MTALLVIFVYVVGVVACAGTLLPNIQAGWPIRYDEITREINAKDYRSDLAFAIFLALIPLSWVLAPFVSGFWEHGWGFSRKFGQIGSEDGSIVRIISGAGAVIDNDRKIISHTIGTGTIVYTVDHAFDPPLDGTSVFIVIGSDYYPMTPLNNKWIWLLESHSLQYEFGQRWLYAAGMGYGPWLGLCLEFDVGVITLKVLCFGFFISW